MEKNVDQAILCNGDITEDEDKTQQKVWISDAILHRK